MLPRALLFKFIRKPSSPVSLFQFNQQACYYAFTTANHTVVVVFQFNIFAYISGGLGFLQRELHSRNKKAMEFIAKGWNALKEVDRVIDYCELNDKRLIPLLRVIQFYLYLLLLSICFLIL